MTTNRAVLVVVALAVLAIAEQTAGNEAQGLGGSARQFRTLQDWQQGRLLRESKEPWVEPVSWTPRAFVFHNFLSDEEADHIVALAKPLMKQSTVVGANGDSVLDNIRTSYGTFLSRLQDPVITEVERRIASWTKLNISHQEDVQVLRYAHGQKYGAHFDSLDEDSPRVATVLLYLSDVEEGGETAFPNGSEWVDPSVREAQGPLSKCAQGSVAAKARRGDALLFFSLHPDGSPDTAAMHTGCPVIKGIKWTATVWIHTTPFRPESLGQVLHEALVRPEECLDEHKLCQSWADAGECKRNKSYMAGDGFSLGACRKACGECEVCAPGDHECRNSNRIRAGYLSLDDL